MQKFPPLIYISKYTFLALVVCITLVATFIRLKNYDLTPLWLDEAWRANFILDPDVYKNLLDGSTYGAITTFGYVAIIKIIAWFNVTEAALRLSSLAPSIAVIPLIIYTVRTLTGYRTIGLIAGIVFTFNPDLVSYAKELKPYSFELFIHSVSILLTLKYVREENAEKSLLLLYVVLVWWLISILSATNFVFLFPGSVICVLIYQFNNGAIKPIKITLIAAAFISLVALMQYIWIWSAAPKDEGLIQFWSNNFYIAGEVPYLTWLSRHIISMAEAVHTSAGIDGTGHMELYGYLFLIGIISCFTVRPIERLLLLVSPLLLMVVLNALMMWPIGDIRVNIFAYVYVVIIAMTGIAAIARFMVLRWAVLGYFIYVAFLALPHIDNVYSKMVPPFQDVPSVLESLRKDAGDCVDHKKITVVQNPAISHALRYYLYHHTILSKRLQPYYTECVNMKSLPEAYSSPERVTEDLSRYFKESSEIWFVYAHLSSDDLEMLTDIIEKYADISNEEYFENAGLFLAKRRN